MSRLIFIESRHSKDQSCETDGWCEGCKMEYVAVLKHPVKYRGHWSTVTERALLVGWVFHEFKTLRGKQMTAIIVYLADGRKYTRIFK
jgi:hypothetical protein